MIITIQNYIITILISLNFNINLFIFSSLN